MTTFDLGGWGLVVDGRKNLVVSLGGEGGGERWRRDFWRDGDEISYSDRNDNPLCIERR